MYENRLDLSQVHQAIETLKGEVRKIIVGQDKMLELLIAGLLAKGHILIEGMPGLAKTLTAKVLSKTISTDFKRIQFTPDLMPSDITGTSIYNFQNSEFEFRRGPIFSNIVLIDEINRAPAKTQAALFEVMEERQITVDGNRYILDEPFMIVATQNPIDFEGTYRLPEAQMDRFLFRIIVEYPSQLEENKILKQYHTMGNRNDLSTLQSILSVSELQQYQKLVAQVHVEENIFHFITSIVQRTRAYRDIELGASPRGSLSILASAKALAVIRGRDFVTPDDILEMAGPVLNHRISLTPEKEMEGTSNVKVISEMLTGVEVPR